MNSAERLTVLHCLKSMIDEEVCEECPLYGITGTDHCEKDCIRLAINALKQAPCTDAIRRQEMRLIDANALKKDLTRFYDNEVTAKQLIDEQPTIRQDPCGDAISRQSENPNKWIPVSERYPEDGQRVLVDYCDEDMGIMLIRFNVNGYRGFKAWMPLPEPYKASPTGEEVE